MKGGGGGGGRGGGSAILNGNKSILVDSDPELLTPIYKRNHHLVTNYPAELKPKVAYTSSAYLERLDPLQSTEWGGNLTWGGLGTKQSRGPTGKEPKGFEMATPPLLYKFFRTCGHSAEISNDGRTAHRKPHSELNNAVLIGNDPLVEGASFKVRVDKKDTTRTGSIIIGERRCILLQSRSPSYQPLLVLH